MPVIELLDRSNCTRAGRAPSLPHVRGRPPVTLLLEIFNTCRDDNPPDEPQAEGRVADREGF